MELSAGPLTLPPPATAAARAERERALGPLVHICSVHTADDGACPSLGCVAYCGHRPSRAAVQVGTTADPVTPDDCVVCVELHLAGAR